MPSAPAKAPSIQLAPETNRLKRETPFNCHIQFRNDLPEIPCDPKLLLPPVNPRELAAFSLTTLEKALKRDMLFEPDLGIPLSAISIQRYAVPEGPVVLDPADQALLESEDEAVAKKGKHGSAPEVSWLLRTSYLTSGHGAEKGGKRGAAGIPVLPGDEGEEVEDTAARIAAIEESFEAAARPPVHATKPELTAVEVLPVLPGDAASARNYVLALFDTDPVADVDRLSRLGATQLDIVKQMVQLKSFAQRKSDGKLDRFVAFLLPSQVPAAGTEALAPRDLQADYEWVREYDSVVRYDEKNSTYLFLRSGDKIGYHDLNTKLALQKRKRAALEGESFLQPEKIVLRLPNDSAAERGDTPGPSSGGEEEEGGEQESPLGVDNASDLDDVGSEGGGEALPGGASALRDAFQDDDDDDAM